MVTPAVRTVLYSAAYAPETRAYFNRLTGTKTGAWRRLADNYIRGLTRNGIWPTLDAIYLMGAGDAQAGCQNVIANQYNLTPTNSPTFTPYRGYTGDGVAAYLDTGANAASLAHFSQNSAHIFTWQLNNVAINGMSIAGNGTPTVQLWPKQAGNKAQTRLNDFTSLLSPSTVDARGLTAVNRSGANSKEMYKNGALLASDTSASSAIVSATIQLLGIAGAYSTGQIALSGVGSGITAAQHAAHYTLANAYVTGILAMS